MLTQDCQQLVVVISEDWQADRGRLFCFERRNSQWQVMNQSYFVMLGKTGMAWGLGEHLLDCNKTKNTRKTEGDNKTPAGIFALPYAFGYAEKCNTGLTYQPMQSNMYCVDCKQHKAYNQIVSEHDVEQPIEQISSEPMRRDLHKDDPCYKKGIFIAQNPQNLPGEGSCVFVHLIKPDGSATAGCTALHEPDMDQLLSWLESEKKPHMVCLPQDTYHQLQPSWNLPALDHTAPLCE